MILPFPSGMCLSCLSHYREEHPCEYPDHCGCDRPTHMNVRPVPAQMTVSDPRHSEVVWTYDRTSDSYFCGQPGEMVPMPAIVFSRAYPEIYAEFWPSESLRPYANPDCKTCEGSGYSRADGAYGQPCPDCIVGVWQ